MCEGWLFTKFLSQKLFFLGKFSKPQKFFLAIKPTNAYIPNIKGFRQAIIICKKTFEWNLKLLCSLTGTFDHIM